jgi:hypothetical protein
MIKGDIPKDTAATPSSLPTLLVAWRERESESGKGKGK